MQRSLNFVALALVMLGLHVAAPYAMAAGQMVGQNRPAPLVAASMAPVHSLLANVMAGVATPLLLMRPGVSPHDYVMRPSETGLLHQADLVFWVGPSAEHVLQKPLSSASFDDKRHVIALIDDPSISPLMLRPNGIWLNVRPVPAVNRNSYLTDPHIWLDPEIAGRIVLIMVRELSRVDPAHGPAYQANGRATLTRLAKLDGALRRELEPVRHVPYLVYHDAFQYFDLHYGMNDIGSIAPSPDVQPGVRLIGELQDAIAARHVKCIFLEPQFSPALAAMLTQGSDARAVVLDPEAMRITPGPNGYFELMTRLGNSLASCLGRR